MQLSGSELTGVGSVVVEGTCEFHDGAGNIPCVGGRIIGRDPVVQELEIAKRVCQTGQVGYSRFSCNIGEGGFCVGWVHDKPPEGVQLP